MTATKNGEAMCRLHLHLNVTYLLEADSRASAADQGDENSEIGWIGVEEIERRSTEKWFVERIYSKLCKKAQGLRDGRLEAFGMDG